MNFFFLISWQRCEVKWFPLALIHCSVYNRHTVVTEQWKEILDTKIVNHHHFASSLMIFTSITENVVCAVHADVSFFIPLWVFMNTVHSPIIFWHTENQERLIERRALKAIKKWIYLTIACTTGKVKTYSMWGGFGKYYYVIILWGSQTINWTEAPLNR